MKIIAELHTHSNEYCDHAGSSIPEFAAAAKEMGLKYLATTNHGPMLDDGTPSVFYMRNIGREFDGIKFLAGIEADLRDLRGGLDLAQRDLLRLDFVIVSMHGCCIEMDLPDYTGALVALAENPAVDCLGHIARDAEYRYDLDTVLNAVKANGKLVEFNNASVDGRDRSAACGHVMDRCAALGVESIVTSDSHAVKTLGNHRVVLKMLEEKNFPEHLIVNASEERMENFLSRRKKEKKAAYDALFVV